MALRKSSPTSLGEYLLRIKEIRTRWKLDEGRTRKGDAGPLWFRGHRHVDWKLVPKLYRKEFSDADENEIRQEFQSRAQQLIQARLPADKWEWYFLMQHYGAPTRLLDWTDNPLTALYFAVADHRGDCDASVWVLDPWWLNRKLRRGIEGPMLPGWKDLESYLLDMEVAFSNKRIRTRLPAAVDPPHVDRRLAAQGSRFVIFGKDHDLMKVKAIRSERVTRRHIEVIAIPNHAISVIQNDLEGCGVTVSSLFPDLEGLCKEICRRWKVNDTE